MASLLQQAMWDAQDRRYGSPEDIQRYLDLARGFESRFGSQPSFFERLRQGQNETLNVKPIPPSDYKKPAGPNPRVPDWKRNQFLLADTGSTNTGAIRARLYDMGVVPVMEADWGDRSALRDLNQAYVRSPAGAAKVGSLAEDQLLEARFQGQDTEEAMKGLLGIITPELTGLGSLEKVGLEFARSIGGANKEAFLAKALLNANKKNVVGLLAERFAPALHELDKDKIGPQ